MSNNSSVLFHCYSIAVLNITGFPLTHKQFSNDRVPGIFVYVMASYAAERPELLQLHLTTAVVLVSSFFPV